MSDLLGRRNAPTARYASTARYAAGRAAAGRATSDRTARSETARSETARSAGPRATVATAPPASVWVRGAFAAAWSVAVGVASLVVLALVVWAADSRSVAGAGGAMRFAVQLWLLAQHTPMRVPGGRLSLPPLGLTLFAGLLVTRATAIVARGEQCRDARDIATVVLSVSAPYAFLASVLAIATPSPALRPSVGAAFLCAGAVGGGFAVIGAMRGSGLVRPAWRSLPLPVRASIEAAGAGAIVATGIATLLTAGSLIAHAHRIAAIAGQYNGAPGEFAMLLISVLLVPNAIVFAMSYLAGPGFAVGSGASVGLGGAHLAATPALPLIAALPSGRASWPVIVLAVVMIAGSGAFTGWRVVRRSTPETRNAPALTLADQLRSVGVAAAVLGVGSALVTGFAGGPAGPGRLSAVGPSPWQVGLSVAGEVGAVAAIVVLATAWSGLARSMASGPAR